MFGIGEEEFLIILLFVFLVFGPDKLPGMGRTIGRAIKQFRNAQEDLSRVVKTELQDPVQNLMDSVDLDGPLQDGDGQGAPAADGDGSDPVADGDKGQDVPEAAASDGDSQASADAARPQESFAQKKARLSAAALYGLDKPEMPAADARPSEEEGTSGPERAEETGTSRQDGKDGQVAEAPVGPDASGKE